ncbi:MAG: glycosyltransferase family 39 protein [Candidatus Paceibacterota bacterium]|jgi:4-amino-4-deoxy-L-arabinose transferase-like glycosyltransferase
MWKHLAKYLYVYLLGLSIVNVLIFGIPHNTVWNNGPANLQKDQLGYHQYAINISSGNGYNISGEGFNSVREPIYPAFLALIYLLFGQGNGRAIIMVQTGILSIIGYIAYILFLRADEKHLGIVIALGIVMLPYYGYYAAEYMTELFFAGMLIFCLYCMVLFVAEPGSRRNQVVCGLVFALTALTRVQMLFFPFFFSVFFLILYRRHITKALWQLAMVLLFFCVPILSWTLIVYQQTGRVAITEGRQEIAIHERAVRSMLSYTEMLQYTKAWLIRSVEGGTASVILDTYDVKGLVDKEYLQRATTRPLKDQIRNTDLATIRTHIGHYFFGNVIEAMKLVYVEHDYSSYMNRYFRVAVYVFIYGLFFLGLYGFYQYRHRYSLLMFTLESLTLLIIAYHIVMLSLFDAIPRMNTPLHALYLLVGAIGLWQWVHFALTEQNT